MKTDEKLALNSYRVDVQSHIKIDPILCKECEQKNCVLFCPAGLYSLDESGAARLEYSGCLECGTCMLVCVKGAISWNYPRGGFGIRYRYG